MILVLVAFGLLASAIFDQQNYSLFACSRVSRCDTHDPAALILWFYSLIHTRHALAMGPYTAVIFLC